MLLTVKNITKTYGIITVLNDISFVLNRQERIGLVGPNGVGKSTLLHILTRQENADQGSIVYANGVEYGFLAQSTPQFYGQTIDDLLLESVGNLRQLEVRMHQLEQSMAQTSNQQDLDRLLEEYNTVSTQFVERGGYELDHHIDRVLAGLRINYLPRTQTVSTLSGGEKARVGLAALLLRSPDVLLLDEPTNHLDFASIEWLESYLADYHGALLVVSHDRHFLNKAINYIFEIDEHQHQLKMYTGNYDAYVEAKKAERIQWEETYAQQQEEMQQLRKRIRELRKSASRTSFGPPRDNDKYAYNGHVQSKQNSSASRLRGAEQQLKLLEANAVPKPPKILRVNSQFNPEQTIQSEVVIRLTQVSKSFGERVILQQINAEVSSDARILLTGANGTGKTTLFKMIMGLETLDAGEIQFSPSARIGYLPQDPLLDPEKTVIETYRYDQVGYEDEFTGRLIGYGLFKLEDMQKKVEQLSLGQKRKLEIARLMAQNPNVLLLDEPTNYISLDILEAFEHAIMHFPGPVIAITHDRWFMQRIGGMLWELKEGQIVAQIPAQLVR
ncbi:ribosomal protection-like ABC-F family protein [Dictyobacter formicarum]|uniref:ABC transporter ATP-binding protein n=1 Tax=Dictyobacter formicarum TaxID=2778368 RepID=A0ABQ3VJF6_9CHLR|nr:ABC-F family ATP-binding cassette domain-containing protein [Dictyobacter formicarum]GHO86297.1 ABC transporter ATP-binding protein [Dictyobacter formicarum]